MCEKVSRNKPHKILILIPGKCKEQLFDKEQVDLFMCDWDPLSTSLKA